MPTDFFILILLGVNVVLLLALLIAFLTREASLLPRLRHALAQDMNRELGKTAADLEGSVRGLGDTLHTSVADLSDVLQDGQQAAGDKLLARQQVFETKISSELEAQRRQTMQLRYDIAEQLEKVQEGMERDMAALREENAKKLEEIRGTVDEKLQDTLEKRISESFKTVSDQLEQVYKGLGEMQTLAGDVGGLKKVLSGVKTRGILGEVQLGAILEEILSPEQYETNVATVPGSRERVEFAVRLPARDGTVYLPIDAKFPGDTYEQLLTARESGDKARLEQAGKALENVLRAEAKDIRDKYVQPPATTNFGILFLPFEGLYAEVVNRGLLERLQREYRISVAGPSTMAALLNSLQMGFRTLAIQKRSGEVWQVLGSVKTEFDKFEASLLAMKKHLDSTSLDLDDLMGTRTRSIQRKLREIQTLPGPDDTDGSFDLLPDGSGAADG